MPQGVYSGFGLPTNYTNNPMYQYYMMQLMQQQQQQALFMQQQQQLQQQQQAADMDAYYSQMSMQEQAAAQQAPQVAAQQPSQYIPKLPNAQAATDDGVDDGKISWSKKLKNFGKGVGNFFKGMVCDENGKFSVKRTLTTAAVAGAAVALTVATGGAAAPYLVAAGATLATYQTGKGVYKACTAKTDREAEQAWQEIGSGTTAMVASVVGAKGALKSSGVDVSAAKYSGIKGSLRATGECFKIAGEGAWNAKGAMLHPMQTARSVRGYWNDTAKPNLEQAFSWKNGYKNSIEAEQAKINKNIADIEAKMSDIRTKMQADGITQAQKNELLSQYQELMNQRTNAEVHSAYNQTRAQNGPSASASRENFMNMAEQRLKTMQEQLKTATGEQKAALESDIKILQGEMKYFKNNFKIDAAQERINRAQQMIAELEAEKNLPTQSHNLTAAQEARLNSLDSRINTLKSAIAKDKQILRNANYKIAAQKHLPNVGLAYGSFYLSGAAPQTINDENAKLYGFESKDQMIQAAEQYGMTAEQLADAIERDFAQQGTTAATAAQQLAQAEAEQKAMAEQLAQQQAAYQQQAQQYNPYASNPYGQYAYNQSGQYMGDNMFRFNELYQSPYPDMI